METTKSTIKKTISFVFAMLIFVGVIAITTYLIAYNQFKPIMLIAPTNVTLLDGNILTWDCVEYADSYTIHISSGNNDVTINIFDTMYTVNELNKIAYDLDSSFSVETDKNYSFSVRANSETIQNSGYSETYELIQVE